MDRNELDKLDRDIVEREASLSRDRARLDSARAACRHKWSETRYIPDHQEAYTIPGDAPGTCGSDWREPVDIPAKTTKKWTRQCESCGFVQITIRTKEEYASGRVAGTGGKIEVPSFPEESGYNRQTKGQ